MAHDESSRAPISHFFGIAIAMYQTDRAPPHFHATYEAHEALIAIDTLEFVDGWLPKRAYALVLEWAAQHRAELRANWDGALKGRTLERVVPLE
ncbi:MAG: DUF4160 domain-containing protein [Anaeromyxobacteraceae bacterium]